MIGSERQGRYELVYHRARRDAHRPRMSGREIRQPVRRTKVSTSDNRSTGMHHAPPSGVWDILQRLRWLPASRALTNILEQNGMESVSQSALGQCFAYVRTSWSPWVSWKNAASSRSTAGSTRRSEMRTEDLPVAVAAPIGGRIATGVG